MHLTICRAAAVVLAALAFQSLGLAQSCYVATITNQTSVTIPYTTHNKGRQQSIRVYDSSGNVRPTNTFTVKRNSANDIEFTFPQSFTGSAKICGPYTMPTNNAYDFEPNAFVSANNAVVTLCEQCTHAARNYNGHSGRMSQQYSFQIVPAEDEFVTVRSWIEHGVLVWGVSASTSTNQANPGTTGGAVEVRHNVTAFPSGVLTLFQGVAKKKGGTVSWDTWSDQRPF